MEYLKSIFVFCLIFSFFTIVSCQKENDTPNPEPTPEKVNIELVWSNEVSFSDIAQVSNLFKFSNQEYIALGLWSYEPYKVMKFSEMGDTLWTKVSNEIDSHGSDDIKLFELLDDDTFLIAKKNILRKYDVNFNTIWELELEGEATNSAYCITKDKGIIVNVSDNSFVKYDSNGVKEWEKNIPEVCKYPGDIVQTIDGGFAFLGCVEQPNIVKISASGEFEWALENYAYTTAISPTLDGGVLALTVRELTSNPPCQIRRKLFAEKINSQGIVEWSTSLENGCLRSTEQKCLQYENYFIVSYLNHDTGVNPQKNTYMVEILGLDGEKLARRNHGLSYRGIAGPQGARLKNIGMEVSDGHYTFVRIAAEENQGFQFPVEMVIEKMKISN